MKYLIFCLVSMIILVLSAGSVKTELPSRGYFPGETIPDIKLTDLGGNFHHLSDYRGKKVVINFWSACHAQSRVNNIQLFNYLQKSDKDVEFVSVAFDDNRNVVERTMALDRLGSVTQFYEKRGPGSEIYKDFKLNEGFRNYLIDENGVIIAMNITPGYLKTIL